MDKWIKIKDSMPEEFEVVMVFDEEFGVCTAHREKNDWYANPFFSEMHVLERVICWMSRPDDPEDL